MAKSVLTPQRQVWRWFSPLGRGLGMWAFALNRVTGIGLVVYLYLHLVILSLLAGGPGSWNAFTAVARSPLILALDVILIAGVLIHGLNGIRVTLIGKGIALRVQKSLFIALMAIALLGVVVSALKIYGWA